MDVNRQRQPPNELFKVRNPFGRLAGVFIRGGKERGFRIFKQLLLPLGELVLAEVVLTTQFCLGTFTAECLKNNFRFKLGGEVSAFSFGPPSETPFK